MDYSPKHEIVRIGKLLYERRLNVAYGENLSIISLLDYFKELIRDIKGGECLKAK